MNINLFKDQIIVIGNNRENSDNSDDSTKLKDGDNKIKDNVGHSYIGDEYKDFVDEIFKYRLKDRELYLTSFDNLKDLKNTINRYLKEKDIDSLDNVLSFEKSMKNSKKY